MKLLFAAAASLLVTGLTQAVPAQIPCDGPSIKQLVRAEMPPPAGRSPIQLYAHKMSEQCFVGIGMDACDDCDGSVACMKNRNQQAGLMTLMQSTPECEGYLKLASSFKPARRLRRNGSEQREKRRQRRQEEREKRRQARKAKKQEEAIKRHNREVLTPRNPYENCCRGFGGEYSSYPPGCHICRN